MNYKVDFPLLNNRNIAYLDSGATTQKPIQVINKVEEFYKNLEDGYQIYFTYVRNRYLLFKTSENCYTQQLLTVHDKNPQPRHSMITFKRVKEMFPHMEEIEYKTGL